MFWKKLLLALKILLLLCFVYWAVLTLCGWREARKKYFAMLEAVPVEGTADFTAAGCTRMPFNHTVSLGEHGCGLYIELPCPSQMELRSIFGAEPGKVRLYDGDKCLCDNDIHIQEVSILDIEGFRLLAVVWPPVDLDFKEYTLEIEVVNPVDNPELAQVHLLGKYRHCGLERLPQTYYGSLFFLNLICVLVLASIVLKNVLGILRLRRKVSGGGILYLTGSYPRWSEGFLRQDLRFMGNLGLQLQVVSLFPGDCELQEGEAVPVVLEPEVSGKTSGSRACRWVPSRIRAWVSLFKHRRTLKKLTALCVKKEIGHIHAEFADLGALLASRVAARLGCTYSIGLHAADVHSGKYPAAMLFGGASFITVCNKAAADAFLKNCPDAAGKLRLIPHGIDLERWQFVEERQSGDTVKILFAGRFVPKKGLANLLEALELLVHKHNIKAVLIAAGEGPLEEELRQLADKLGIADCVKWLGRLERSEIRNLMAQNTCLCVPSVVAPDGDRDGIPNVVMEAMAAGLPVVGSQAGGLPEVLGEATGWPVKNPTPDNIAAAIMDMNARPEETERRRRNARTMMESRFDGKKLGLSRVELFSGIKASAPSSVK